MLNVIWHPFSGRSSSLGDFIQNIRLQLADPSHRVTVPKNALADVERYEREIALILEFVASRMFSRLPPLSAFIYVLNSHFLHLCICHRFTDLRVTYHSYVHGALLFHLVVAVVCLCCFAPLHGRLYEKFCSLDKEF